MHLQQGWLDYAAQLADAPEEEPARTEERRRAMEGEKERATKAFVAGALPEGEWRRVVRRIDIELAEIPIATSSVAVGAFSIASMAEAWEWLTPAERNELFRTLFVGVRIDVVNHDIWLEPAEEFIGAFEARRLYCSATKAEQDSAPGNQEAPPPVADALGDALKVDPTPDRTRTCAFGSGGRHSIR